MSKVLFKLIYVVKHKFAWTWVSTQPRFINQTDYHRIRLIKLFIITNGYLIESKHWNFD